jgi:hypothetical protein
MICTHIHTYQYKSVYEKGAYTDAHTWENTLIRGGADNTYHYKSVYEKGAYTDAHSWEGSIHRRAHMRREHTQTRTHDTIDTHIIHTNISRQYIRRQHIQKKRINKNKKQYKQAIYKKATHREAHITWYTPAGPSFFVYVYILYEGAHTQPPPPSFFLHMIPYVPREPHFAIALISERGGSGSIYIY